MFSVTWRAIAHSDLVWHEDGVGDSILFDGWTVNGNSVSSVVGQFRIGFGGNGGAYLLDGGTIVDVELIDGVLSFMRTDILPLDDRTCLFSPARDDQMPSPEATVTVDEVFARCRENGFSDADIDSMLISTELDRDNGLTKTEVISGISEFLDVCEIPQPDLQAILLCQNCRTAIADYVYD